MPALFVWRNRRPARAMWPGLLRVRDRWGGTSPLAPSAVPCRLGCAGVVNVSTKGGLGETLRGQGWSVMLHRRQAYGGVMRRAASCSAFAQAPSSTPDDSWSSPMIASGMTVRGAASSPRSTPPSGVPSSDVTVRAITKIRRTSIGRAGRSCASRSLSCEQRYARGCSRSYGASLPRHKKARPDGRADWSA